MSSTLACLGLAVDSEPELAALLTRVLPDALLVGRIKGAETYRWTDASGARLTITARDGELEELTASYAGPPSATLREVTRVHESIASAEVHEGGELVTRLAADLEQGRYLASTPFTTRQRAAVTALGAEVTVYADAAAYDASGASRLGDDPDGPRLAVESFLPYGLFAADPADVSPFARLSGTVESARTHTVGLTGQSFHDVLVVTAGFGVTLCLAADEHAEAPAPGSVVSGTCYLVASLDILFTGADDAPQVTPRRRLFRRH